MAPRKKRKSRRRRKSSPLQRDQLAAIRALIRPPRKIFRLVDFVQQYAPSLNIHESIHSCKEIFNMVVSPMEDSCLAPVPHVKTPDCREPVQSLVDDIVWLLVQRRDRLKRLGFDGQNILAEGYISPSMEGQNHSIPQIRPGVICIRPNDNVSFCKSSQVFRRLHTCVGDEVFRMILLYTSLFVPVEVDFQNPRGNFTLVCGPPFRNGTPQSNHKDNSVEKRKCNHPESSADRRPKKKRRRRSHLEVEARMQPNATISRYSLFYSDNFIPKIGFPRSHLLNGPVTSEQLLTSMTDLSNEKGVKRRKRWKRLRPLGIGVCQQILRGHKNCDYPRLLQRHCPLPEFLQKRDYRKPNSSGDLKECATLPELAKEYTSGDQVVAFMSAVLRKVFPASFWGSDRNLANVLDSVKLFVSLRRKERLPNKSLMHGMRVTKITWLLGNQKQGSSLSRTDHESSNFLALKVLRWLFRGFIIPLLRSNFYVTETEFSGKQVLYYRKPVWSLFRCLAMKKLLQKQFYELTESEARKRSILQKMGFSQLRLVPKPTGVRPITHLSKRGNITFQEKKVEALGDGKKQMLSSDSIDHLLHSNKRMKISKTKNISTKLASLPSGTFQRFSRLPSTNTVLTELFDVLRYECGRKAQSYGAGMGGLVDFYPRYHAYISSLKQRYGPDHSLQLHFGSVDIEKCYDNINQEYLLDIAKRQISHSDYFIQQFNILYANEINGGLTRRSKKVVGPPELFSPIHQGQNEISRQTAYAIFDSRKCMLANKSRLLELLGEHLRSNLVVTTGRYRNRTLLQSSGIPQGSILSTMLCNLYYGELEGRLLHEENPQSPCVDDYLHLEALSFMSRLVDDFIFISTEKNSVTNFLQRMYEGKPELGVRINREKTLVSTAIELELNGDNEEASTLLLNPQRIYHKRNVFAWCGMLFNTSTGEVFMDYERFSGGKIRDNLTVDRCGTEGRMLRFRMEGFVRPRCLPILFDSTINRKKTIVMNYYQIMLFSACKTAEHLRSSNFQTTSTSNLKFFFRCIAGLSSFAARQVRSNLKKHCPVVSRDRFVLNKIDTSWLCWRAFHDVFCHLSDFEDLAEQIGRQVQGVYPGLQKVVREAFDLFQLNDMIQF